MKKALLVYVTAYVVLLIFVLGMLYAYPKAELHMLLNSYHTGIQDTFFKYYSMLAEGPLYALALLPLFWKKIKITIFYAMCEISGGGLLQILKHFICSERPASVFENYSDMFLPVVAGVDLHHSNSFPSGHASTFFIFCTCCAIVLAYHYKKKSKSCNHRAMILFNLSLLSLLILAALGAYSRVYLSQHFLLDVCVGSIIGVITPCLIFYFCRDRILKLKTNETE